MAPQPTRRAPTPPRFPAPAPTPLRRGRRPASAPAAIPRFMLYGETAGDGVDELHVEEIQSRSRLYRWEIDAHVHTAHHQLLWLQRGHADVALDESRSTVEGPALVAIPPGVVHAFRFEPHSQGHVVTLSPRALVEGQPAVEPAALRALFGQPQVLALDAGDDGARLAALFEQLQSEFVAPGQAGSPVPLWLARAVVWRAAQVAAREARAARPGLRSSGAHHALQLRFLALVEAQHLSHWPVQRYADRLGTSTDRLNRVTQAHAGRSAQQVIHDRLLREACRRLTYLVAPVSRIGFELGFEDPAYFCRFFKRGTGMSPSRYRATQAPSPG